MKKQTETPEGINCTCPMCNGEIDYQIITHGTEEYIILGSNRNAQLLTNWHCSEGASFHMHENVVRDHNRPISVTTAILKSEYAADLWPLKVGIFGPEATVALYRQEGR
jgi:hypothetical protein